MRIRNNRTLFKSIACCAVFLSTYSVTYAQSGGGFEITEAVIAAGGGSSSNGTTQVDSTSGQPIAGGAIGSGNFGLTSGFWNFTQLAPTAAHVSIGGRVVDPAGNGVPNATLYMHTQEGELRVARTSPFGYFHFEDIAAGQTVLLSVSARRYTYTPQTVIVAGDISDLAFTPELPAQPSNESGLSSL